MEMAHSVEGRVPFLDHRVVECVCRAPVPLKIRGVTEKYLLREAAKPLITETVYHRQKHPFLSPPVTSVPTERFHQMHAGHAARSGPRLASVLRSARIVALLDQLPVMSDSDRIGWDPVLMSVLSACLIQERFMEAPTSVGDDAFGGQFTSHHGDFSKRSPWRIPPLIQNVKHRSSLSSRGMMG